MKTCKKRNAKQIDKTKLTMVKFNLNTSIMQCILFWKPPSCANVGCSLVCVKLQFNIILELFCDKFIIKIYVCYLLEQSCDTTIVK
jgi:hypothetical protein